MVPNHAKHHMYSAFRGFISLIKFKFIYPLGHIVPRPQENTTKSNPANTDLFKANSGVKNMCEEWCAKCLKITIKIPEHKCSPGKRLFKCSKCFIAILQDRYTNELIMCLPLYKMKICHQNFWRQIQILRINFWYFHLLVRKNETEKTIS